MIIPETFSTERLLLRRPKPSDAPALFEFASDPEVVKYMDWPRSVVPADGARAAEVAMQKWESGEEYSWRLTLPPGDTPFGSMGCRIHGEAADFGYVLNRRYWGRGYATEASAAIVEWLKSLDTIEWIHATCDFENVASARVLEKVGLAFAKRLPSYTVRPNLPGAPRRDAFLYSWRRPR